MELFCFLRHGFSVGLAVLELIKTRLVSNPQRFACLYFPNSGLKAFAISGSNQSVLMFGVQFKVNEIQNVQSKEFF